MEPTTGLELASGLEPPLGASVTNKRGPRKKPEVTPERKLLSKREFGEIVGRSSRTISRYMDQGIIQFRKIGKAVFIPKTEVERLFLAESGGPV